MLTVIDLSDDGNHKREIHDVNTRWTVRAVFTDDGKSLALTDHRSIKLLDPDTLKVTAKREWPAVHNVDFSPMGRILACNNYVAGLKIYDFDKDFGDLSHIGEFRAVPNRSNLRFTADGRLLTIERDQMVLRNIDASYLADESRSDLTVARHYAALRAAIAPDNETVVSSGEQGFIYVSSLDTGKRWHTLRSTRRIMRAGIRSFPDIAIFSAQKELAVAVVNRNAVDIYGLKTGVRQRTIIVGETSLVALAISPDSKTLATWDEKGGLCLTSISSEAKQLIQLNNSPHTNFAQTIEYSPDGRFIAVPGNEVLLIDAATLENQEVLHHPGMVACLAFSPDSTQLLTACHDRVMRMWDTTTGKKIREFLPHESRATSVAWSPDGKTIASASEGRVKLWNVRTLEETITLTDFLPMPLDLEFSPNGESLVAAAFEGAIRVWKAPQAIDAKTASAR